MAGKVEIISNALLCLGEEAITDLTDTSKRAVTAVALYPIARDYTLRLRRWNFAEKRASLARLASTPAWGYAYAYQLPSDCLRVWSTEHQKYYPWKVEGRQLLTNADSANIEYTYRNDNPGDYDSGYVEVLIAYLAFKMAWPITQREWVQRSMWDRFQDAMREAAAADGQEGTGGNLESPDLVDVRL